MECPRGHHFKIGRFTPGIAVRLKSRCKVCREYQITYGLVTPFVTQIVPFKNPRLLTTVRSDRVRRQLTVLADHPDIQRLLDRIPRESTLLTVQEVMDAMEGWLRQLGRPGGAVPEEHQIVEVLSGTHDPKAAISFLRRRCSGARDEDVEAVPTGALAAAVELVIVVLIKMRIAASGVLKYLASEIHHSRMRITARSGQKRPPDHVLERTDR